MRNSILVPIRDLEPEWNTAMYGLFNLSDIHTRIVTSCPRVVNTVVPPSAERKNSAAAGHRLPNANKKRHPPPEGSVPEIPIYFERFSGLLEQLADTRSGV